MLQEGVLPFKMSIFSRRCRYWKQCPQKDKCNTTDDYAYGYCGIWKRFKRGEKVIEEVFDKLY